MQDVFAKLGEHIATTWDRDPATLPDLAADALERWPACAHTTLDALLARGLAGELPAQRDRGMTFGEPPITVFHHPDFVVEVNLWVDGTTQVHEHAFCGAFQLLHGGSLEARHHFAVEEVERGLALGSLTLASLTELRPGEVRRILPGAGSTHALFHLERPSATVVIRTHADRSALPQHSYWWPSVRAPGDPWELLTDAEVRQVQLLLSLLNLGRLPEPLPALSVPATWVLVTEVISPRWLRGGISLAQMEAGLSPWLALLPEALSRAAHQRHFQQVATHLRPVVPESQRRTLGLLLLCPDRAALERTAPALCGSDAETVLVDFVTAIHEAATGPVDVLGLDDAHSAWVVARIRGEVEDSIVADEITRLSVLAPWFR